VGGLRAPDLDRRRDAAPKNVQSAQRIKTLLKSFGGSEPVVVAISGKGEEDLEDRIDLALAIRERLADHPDIHTVTGLFGEDPWACSRGRRPPRCCST